MKQSWFARIIFYKEEKVSETMDFPFEEGNRKLAITETLKIHLQMKQDTERSLSFSLEEGRAEQIGIALICRLEEWKKPNYVLMPGAVYNGNRFPVYPCPYPPFRYGDTEREKDNPEMITDIPHLGTSGGKMQFHAGDMTEPVVGVFCAGKGFLLQTGQQFGEYETGISLLETDTNMEIAFSVPCVKENKYRITKCGYPSDDRAATLTKGQFLKVAVKTCEFECTGIQNLFDTLFRMRNEWNQGNYADKRFPFGNCEELLEEKFNRTDWEEKYGYYSMGPRPGYERAWILGWPGMMMYPMLLNGSPLTRQRALKNIDYILEVTQAPTGFFYASAGGRECFGDSFAHREWKNWGLIRRNADALFYLAKCLMVIREKHFPYDTARLEGGIRRCADAFVTLYQKKGQLGQFVDVDSGEILIPDTSSAALAAGALVLCGLIFKQSIYGKTAEQMADYYYTHYVQKGITNGGPGEILQAPDSESAYSMTASFVTLYQVTKKIVWLDRAGEMAKQFATWCMPYNYRFPENSEFGQLGMKTVGTVFANVQNKHSAPGICTHSGIELLQLYRYTGDSRYLQLISEIAGTIPQYLSRKERPIKAREGKVLPPGWMHERVNTSDWEGTENIGTVGYGNCWCSVSLMMTCAELPGVYVCPGNGIICAIDHVNAGWSEGKEKIWIENPTGYDTTVSIWVDKEQDVLIPAFQYQRVFCPAKTVQELSLR